MLGVVLLITILGLGTFSGSAAASIGVGVGTGRIVVREELKAGGIYTLPSVTVFNTGTEEATYTMDVTLNEKQPQLKPDPAWFSFSPRQFKLKPKQSQVVVPTLRPPLKTKPGAYFAYLEAHPAETVQQGGAAVGVAAATKLSFSLSSSNIFYSLWYRLQAIFREYQPWSQIVSFAFLGTALLMFFGRFINLRAAIRAFWAAGRKSHSDDSDK